MAHADHGLVQRSHFSSSDEDEVTGFIRQMYVGTRSRFAPIENGAQFSASTNDTAGIGADRVRTTIDYGGTTTEGFGQYVFFVVHSGSVHMNSHVAELTVRAGETAFYPIGVPLEFEMHEFDVTTLRLPVERIQQVAEDATGVPAAEVRFHGVTPVSESMRRYWRALTSLVSGALAEPDSPMAHPLLAEDMARTVATAALHTFPNTTMTRQHVPGPGNVAPATMRRAVAHIEANAHLPLQLSEIAAAAGTSARSLQYGFRRSFGTTPLGYLRRVRLEQAHRELRAADPSRGETVAAIATRWGFANPGRFARAYRDAYGVLPGDTLRS